MGNKKKTKKELGRRRRGKKDVILDFTKRAKRHSSQDTMNSEHQQDDKLKNTGIRKFETTGQYFRRLDRLIAKAKVEANLETRFDVDLKKNKQDSGE